MEDKFGKDSMCGGDSTNYGSSVDWSTGQGVTDLPSCKAKCLTEGKAVCNNLLYISTGPVCKAYTKLCN